MSLFILFVIKLFDRIFEDIVFISNRINYLISNAYIV